MTTKRSFRNQLLFVNICARLLGKIRFILVSISIRPSDYLGHLDSPGTLHARVTHQLLNSRLDFRQHLNGALFLADPLKQAKIDEAIADAKNMKFMYFAYVKIFGRPETAEGLKEAEDSFQALSDLRFKVRMIFLFGQNLTLIFRMEILIWLETV